MCIKCTKDSIGTPPLPPLIRQSGGNRSFSESHVGFLRPAPLQRSRHHDWDVDFAQVLTGFPVLAVREGGVSAVARGGGQVTSTEEEHCLCPPTADKKNHQSERLRGGKYCFCLSREVTHSVPELWWRHCVEATGDWCRYPVILRETRLRNLCHIVLVVIN